jgi:hypothetical protein
MAITRTDPEDFRNATTVQVESNARDNFTAIDEVERWAADNGFVRTSEYSLRQVLVGGQRRFRGICYRVTAEERAAQEHAQRQMIDRGDALMRGGAGGGG